MHNARVLCFIWFRHLCLSITSDNRDETITIRPTCTARPCNSLGTPSNPALSCEQLKEACIQAQSGHYFIQGGHAIFCKVHYSAVWHHFILGRSQRVSIILIKLCILNKGISRDFFITNKCCTLNKPAPKISHVNTLQNYKMRCK